MARGGLSAPVNHHDPSGRAIVAFLVVHVSSGRVYQNIRWLLLNVSNAHVDSSDTASSGQIVKPQAELTQFLIVTPFKITIGCAWSDVAPWGPTGATIEVDHIFSEVSHFRRSRHDRQAPLTTQNCFGEQQNFCDRTKHPVA